MRKKLQEIMEENQKFADTRAGEVKEQERIENEIQSLVKEAKNKEVEVAKIKDEEHANKKQSDVEMKDESIIKKDGPAQDHPMLE